MTQGEPKRERLAMSRERFSSEEPSLGHWSQFKGETEASKSSSEQPTQGIWEARLPQWCWLSFGMHKG